jgi:hypothetical protein
MYLDAVTLTLHFTFHLKLFISVLEFDKYRGIRVYQKSSS